MVSANVRTSANRIQDTLESRDIEGIALIGAAVAGGVVLAQEVSDRILPALNLPMDPTNAKEFAASAGSKTVLALLLGAGAARMDGLPLIALAFVAVGAIGSGAADLLNMVQRTGLAAEAPRASWDSSPSNYATGTSTPSRNSGSGSSTSAASVTV